MMIMFIVGNLYLYLIYFDSFFPPIPSPPFNPSFSPYLQSLFTLYPFLIGFLFVLFCFVLFLFPWLPSQPQQSTDFRKGHHPLQVPLGSPNGVFLNCPSVVQVPH